MDSLKDMWNGTKVIGKMAFAFRGSSFLYHSFIIYYHHYSHGLRMGMLEYITIAILVISPFIFITEFYLRPLHKELYIKHATIDLFIVGWCVAELNFSVVPSVILVTAVITNYITTNGFDKVYRILYLPLAASLVFFISGEEFVFSSNVLLQSLSFIYGLIHFSLMSYISYKFSLRYYTNSLQLKEQKEEINSQNEEIQQQAEELQTLNNALNKLNINLEGVVAERTIELEEKNMRLEKHAFFNAHKLRAPLARIIGLTQFFDYRENIRGEEDNVIELLKASAQELDDIVNDINKNLE